MPSAYFPIASVTLTASTASVTFSSIPATYTDLVLVADYLSTPSADAMYIRFNGDSAGNYSRTQLYGTGTASGTNRASNESSIPALYAGTSTRVNSIIEIMNYANTTTYKTVLYKLDDTSLNILRGVGIWRKTPEAINTILIQNNTNSFTANSTFSLYGIKAA